MSSVLPKENSSVAVAPTPALAVGVDAAASSAALIPSPYVGLVPFAESDAEYFFGRDRDIEVVATNLRSSRLTIFYGASGVGKSSLLRAGVLPYFQRLTALSTLPGEPPDFLLVMQREWANDPLDSLRSCLEKTIGKAVEDKTLTNLFVEGEWKIAQVSDVTETARANDNNRNMSSLLECWTNLIGAKLLVIFDQFEDFFLHPEFCAGSGSFGEEFPKAVNDGKLPVNFMLSLRDDGLSKLDFFKGKIQDSMNNTLRLLHLDRARAEEAIRKPLDKYNQKMDTNFSIEDGLVEQILDDVQVDKVKFESQGQAHVKQVVATDVAATASIAYQLEAPYLQLVMKRLWKDEHTQQERRLTSETLNNKLGGVQKIVETHLEEVMNRLSPADRELAAEFIHFTVTRSGAKISSNADDLANRSELPKREEDIKRILRQLSEGETRIFKSVQNLGDASSNYYEVSHDALTPAILSWRTRYVLKREKNPVWQIKQIARKYPRLSSGFAAFVLALLIGLIWFINSARVAKAEAEKQKLGAEEASEAAIDATERSEVIKDISVTLSRMVSGSAEDREEGLKQLAEIFKKEKVEILPADLRTELEKLLGTIQEDQSNANEYDVVREGLEKTRRASIQTLPSQVQTSNQTIADQLPSRVYIHISDEGQRSNAGESATLLQANKFAVPGIRKVDDLKLNDTQVRFFRKIDGGLASQVVQLLQSQGIRNVRVQYVRGYEDSTAMRPKHLEVWFAADAFASGKY